MTHLYYYISGFFLLFLLTSCGGKTQAERHREEAELEGSALLVQAREALGRQEYEKARRAIRHLRKDQPLALDARRQAILLLDSIELASARDSVRYVEGEEWERLTMKVQFYERKLQEDRKGYGISQNVSGN